MDKRLLFGRSRRRQWPRKNPPVVRIATTTDDSWKTDLQVVTHLASTQSSPWSVASRTIVCFCRTFANYSMYEILGHWIAALPYTPLDNLHGPANDGQETNTELSPLLTTFTALLLVCYLLHSAVQHFLEEYRIFLALGQGGTPCTPMGMVKVTIMGYFANVDVLDPPYIDPNLEPSRGKLPDLPQRSGPRPTVRGVAPQRQFDQKPIEGTFDRLSQVLKNVAAGDENLKIATSYLEGHTEALKGVSADQPHQVLGTDGEWDYEIAHPHRIDSSMHLVCHPEDCKKIIEAGWGEKHPLSTDARWWKFFHHIICRKRLPVPPNLVLVYGPRTPPEVRLVERCIDAAVWFHKEKDICSRVNQGFQKRTSSKILVPRSEALSNNESSTELSKKSKPFQRASDDKIRKTAAHDAVIFPTCTLAASSPLPAVSVAKSCA